MLSIKLAACHRPLCRSFVGCRLQREFSTYAEPAAAQDVRLPLSILSSKSADGTHGHLCDRLSSMSLWSGLTRNETDDKKQDILRCYTALVANWCETHALYLFTQKKTEKLLQFCSAYIQQHWSETVECVFVRIVGGALQVCSVTVIYLSSYIYMYLSTTMMHRVKLPVHYSWISLLWFLLLRSLIFIV